MEPYSEAQRIEVQQNSIGFLQYKFDTLLIVHDEAHDKESIERIAKSIHAYVDYRLKEYPLSRVDKLYKIFKKIKKTNFHKRKQVLALYKSLLTFGHHSPDLQYAKKIKKRKSVEASKKLYAVAVQKFKSLFK